MSIKARLSLLLLILSFITPTGVLFAAVPAGEVDELSGTVWATLGSEAPRKLAVGDSVFEKDYIKTYRGASVKLIFRDKTRFELGSSSEFRVNKFRFKTADKSDGIITKVFKGTFRFFSGLIAKRTPRSMTVQTSMATIGIRGTQVVGEVNETSATIILLEPEDKDRESSIEVANQFGSVVIDEPGFGTEIPDQFSPPSPPRRMRLQTINNLTRSIQRMQRMNVPRPRTR